MSLWALLFLPLVAVGVAAALMLSWGNFGVDQAQATTDGVDLAMTTTGCNTKTGPTKCTVPVGNTIKIFTDRNALGGADPASGVQGTWEFAGPIKFMDRAGVGEVIGADCSIKAQNLALLPQFYTGSCTFQDPTNTNSNTKTTPPPGFQTFAIDVRCNATGVGTVTLVHSVNDSYILDAGANPHVDKGTDVLTINCVPPDGELQINAVDSLTLTKKVGPTCWLISAKQMVQPNPNSPPVSQNSPKDVVSDNNSIAGCDGIGPLSTDLSDNNPALGQIDITISGINRALYGEVWHAQNVLSPPKYDNNPTKNVCTIDDANLGPDACALQVQFVRLFGNATIEFNDTGGNPIGPPGFLAQCVDVSTKPVVAPVGNFCDNDGSDLDPTVGTLHLVLPVGAYTITSKTAPPGGQLNGPAAINCDLAGTSQTCAAKYTFSFARINVNIFQKHKLGPALGGQCINIETIALPICDNQAGDADPDVGQIEVSVGLGTFSVTVKPDKLHQVKAADAKQSCTLTISVTKCTLTFVLQNLGPHNLKTPSLANLFLNAQGTKLPPTTCASSTDFQTFTWRLSHTPTSLGQKGAVQLVGGFEMEVRFDSKFVCVNLAAAAVPTGGAPTCIIHDKDQGLQPDGSARIGCAIKKPGRWVGNDLVTITVRPQPEAYKLIQAHKNNGIVVSLLNQDCNVTDQTGAPIPTDGCDDAALTIRWLEGDVNGDCRVNAVDQQILSFRWGVKLGHLLFNDRLDLEPSGQINGDGDIDIKDVQFVFGRHNSQCSKLGDQAGGTNPPQPPINPNQTNPPNNP